MAPCRALLPSLAAFLALILLATCQEMPEVDAMAAAAQVLPDAARAAADQRPVQQLAQRRRHNATALPLGDGELGCDDVGKLNHGDDKCAFVRSHCHAESLINYPSLYFCYVTPHGAVSTALMLLGCVVLLALLFRIIARAADDFFSCILSQISQDLGLPPRLGGVTLLALGNGAPDLSASIAAVKSGNYQLAMGALTGAGMFVGGVVAGRIITLSGGVTARGAQLRDISTQFVTVAVVTVIVASGWFTYGSVVILLSIYAAYVVVVAVADFSKRAGVEWKEVARNVTRRVSGRWGQVEMASPLLQDDHGLEAAAGSGPPSGSSSPGKRHAQQQGQLQQQAAEGQGGEGSALDAGQLASAGSMPFPDAHSLPIMDAALSPARGSSPPPSTAGAEPRPFAGGGPASASLPDLSAAAQRRQQQEAYWRPARFAPQAAGHHRHRPPVARFEPRVPYSDLVQMPSWEYRQRALADMAQSKSFYARDSTRRPRQRRILEESAGEDEEEPLQRQRQAGGRGGWEEDSDGGSSEGDGEEGEEDGDLERGWARSPGGNLRSGRNASGSTSSGSRGTHGSYRPPLIGGSSGGAEDRPAGANVCFASATAAIAAAAVAAVDAEAGAAARLGRRQSVERLEREEGAELQQLDRQASSPSRRSAASTPHHSNCHSIGSFEMTRSTADAATAAVAEADAEARGVPSSARGYGAHDTRPWDEGSVDDSLDEQQPSRLRRGLDAVQWPVLLLLTATIPLVEVNSYRRRWFLRSLAASPFFIVAYLHLFTWQAALAALCASAAMVTTGHLGTLKLQDKAPLWCFGTGYPIGAALVALYGFAVAAMWISLFASEIVGLLQFFGMLSKIDPAVLGVTVLAWGNSLMDYLNNTAMAGRSRGGNSMAMTACFAGPLFNMLVGLGLGFWALLQDTGAARTAVTMDPVVLVGCLFVMLNCAGLVGISLTNRQHLPAWCGTAMVGLYALYLSVVLAVIVCF